MVKKMLPPSSSLWKPSPVSLPHREKTRLPASVSIRLSMCVKTLPGQSRDGWREKLATAHRQVPGATTQCPLNRQKQSLLRRRVQSAKEKEERDEFTADRTIILGKGSACHQARPG